MSEPRIKLAETEGVKKGQYIRGLSDIGGVNFFHVVLENCDGNWELVEAAMKGINSSSGGAENIAKALLSANDDRLCIYLHVPELLSETISIKDWFSVLVHGSKATILDGQNLNKSHLNELNSSKWGFAKAELLRADNVFPLKVRDEIIGQGFAYLLSKGVIPADDSDEYEINEEW